MLKLFCAGAAEWIDSSRRLRIGARMRPVATSNVIHRQLVERAAGRQRANASAAVEARRRLESGLTGVSRAFKVQRAILFGSLAWGGFREDSDVDLMVWGAKAEEVDALAAQLGELMQRPMHVVMGELASVGLVERCLREGVELNVT